MSRVTGRIIAAVLVASLLGKPAAVQSDETSVVKANNEFACDLYRKLSATEGNLFFCPPSLSACLGILEPGARGSTRQQIRSVLHLPERNDAGLSEIYLVPTLRRPVDGIEVKSASRLWISSRVVPKPEYLNLVATNSKVELKKDVNFMEPQGVVTEVNKWVHDQTNGQIPRLLETLDAQTKLLITNVVMFEAEWRYPFGTNNTHKVAFNRSGHPSVSVDTMHQTRMFRLVELPDLWILELPYKGDQASFSAVIVLPKKIDGLPAVEQRFTALNWAKWISALEAPTNAARRVDVALPKFGFTSDWRLTEVMKSLGMPQAFTSTADLSGIAGEPLQVSQVLQKAFVEVDEKGTRAGAATAIPVAASLVEKLAIDHPFLFIIRQNSTNAILFCGRVIDPSAK